MKVEVKHRHLLVDSYKPRPISEVALKPRTAYSAQPRVQKAFRRMLNHMRAPELQEQQAKNQSRKEETQTSLRVLNSPAT
jgi:hypothetical protein